MPAAGTSVGAGTGVGTGAGSGFTGAGGGGLGCATLSGGGAADPPALNIQAISKV